MHTGDTGGGLEHTPEDGGRGIRAGTGESGERGGEGGLRLEEAASCSRRGEGEWEGVQLELEGDIPKGGSGGGR